MLTLRNIFDAALFDLGIENAYHSPVPVRQSVLGYIAAALQTMQAAGEKYYLSEDESVTLAIGVGAYDLDEDVQTVLKSPRIGQRTLMEITERSRFDAFGPLFLGQTGRTVANGTPLAYYVDSQKAASGDDPVSIKVRIVPAPAAVDTMTVPVIKQPPTYTLEDLCEDPPLIPPVPHKYHESILLPIVRMNATSHPYFDRNKERFPRIQADYIAALKMLGLANPSVQPRGAGSAEKTSQQEAQPTQ